MNTVKKDLWTCLHGTFPKPLYNSQRRLPNSFPKTWTSLTNSLNLTQPYHRALILFYHRKLTNRKS
jgi:hypothetical protein